MKNLIRHKWMLKMKMRMVTHNKNVQTVILNSLTLNSLTFMHEKSEVLEVECSPSSGIASSVMTKHFGLD